MGIWQAQRFASIFARKARKPQQLQLELLESREVPAVTVQLDYSYDTSGFFNDPSRRALLQSAVDGIAANLNANLAAITPSAGNSWSETFYSPATGQQTTINNPTVGANTLVIYVGGRNTGGAEAGFGGSGGFSEMGTQAWLDSLAGRGPGGSLLWGGSITFDTSTNWFFGTSTTGLTGNQVDFRSVAEHEFGHVLGIGTSPKWFSQSSGGSFDGPAAAALYGSPVPESTDGDHWADGTQINGVRAALDPILVMGTRVSFSALDYAGLSDLGWSVSSIAGGFSQASLSVAPVSVGSPLLSMGSPDSDAAKLVILTGPTDGSTQVFSEGANGQLAAAGPRFDPFPGYTGIIRATVADFNGDGIADFAFATGNGVAATVRIISGATGKDLVSPTTVLGGFTDGVFLAAGDVNHDGTAELAVSADDGGGPRVQLFKINDGQLDDVLDFIAFGTPDFRGGTRVAMADVNRDGFDDLIIGAGIGGGPRVSIYNGASLLSGNSTHLVPDFFAFSPNLRSGVYVSAADFNGDGYSDIAYSTGDTGGPRIRVVSGLELMQNPGADVSSLPAMADFFALDPNDRNGIRVVARDLNGDGDAELIVGSGAIEEPSLRVIPLSQMNTPTNPLQDPFGNINTIDGLYVG